ncbi:MAG: M3 family metallopeptidase [Acidobacteria bacterium]|nr:M3 family metallopeptidase [Acidobacteriota bacterium]
MTPLGSVRALALALPSFAADMENPLLKPSPLPYQLPPFAAIRDEHFLPAFEEGMAEQRREVEAIAGNAEAPTFENTVVALERSGRLLNRVGRAFGILTASLTNPALQKLDAEISPRLAAHQDAIELNPVLFARLEKLHAARASLKLDAVSVRLIERYHEDFVRRGARLTGEGKTRVRGLNEELAKLYAQFRRNVLAEINASTVAASRDELKGLSEAAIKAAEREGGYGIRLTNTTGQPPLGLLEDAPVRRRVMDASLQRGMRGGANDNQAVITAIASKRAEMANLLGFPTYADYQIKRQTAANVETVNKLLAKLAPPAVANARKEAAELEKTAGRPITAADWEYYSEKVRLARYSFDDSQLRPYYEIRRVLVDGVFHAATKLYGITFKERRDLKGYSPDMYVFEVFNEDGSPLGLFLGDFYARPNKRGGAWANPYVPQNGLEGTKPVIGNHLNIPKPPEGQPTLMTHSEVNTMFHEFGHALHMLFNDGKYPRLGGVPRDFVEFPSQVNEMWAVWPEILANYAVHHETGKPMPKELLAKVQAASQFNEGFKTTEYLAASILDMEWHQLAPNDVPKDVAAFEKRVFARHGLDFEPVPPRYRSTYFSHIFGSAGYAAGYYSYIWSEVLDADTVEWFRQNGGLKRANGDRFRKMLLSRGGTEDALEMYRKFRGSAPDTVHLLRRRALQ